MCGYCLTFGPDVPVKTYKGHDYYQDENGLWIVECDGSRFIVGVDDSKHGGRRTFNEDANNEAACIAYIDWKTTHTEVRESWDT